MISRMLIEVTGWLLKPFTEMRKLGRAGLDSIQMVAEHSDLELRKRPQLGVTEALER